jgi:hypothetical protein
MTRTPVELDIENLVGFFQVKLREPDGRIHDFSMYPGSPPINLQALCDILARSTIYTFNGINYDLPILTLALHGATCEQLKEAGDNIILRGWKHWQFYDRYGIRVPEYIDHVDLFDVSPGVNIGLKMLMGRMHAPKIQDLPVPFDRMLTPIERFETSVYCDNDLYGTRMLRDQCKDRLALREAMSEKYGVDVRSKSDAQIAEAVIKVRLPFVPDKRYIEHGYTFKYEAPSYIRFATPQLQHVLAICTGVDFMVSDKEEAIALGDDENLRTGVVIPKLLKGLDIRIAGRVYRMGIGGLHSQESCTSYYSAPGEHTVKDIDVRGYYPSLIIACGMYPEQLGPDFLTIYSDIKHTRDVSKADAEKLKDLGFHEDALQAQTESDGLKIVTNGTFGKLFSKYSIFYAPELGIKVTITGQLALLMLIEMMEMSGISVASANTDGIVLIIPDGMDWVVRTNVEWWERTTGLQMEYTTYRSIHMRDVNNYIAITMEGKVKRKGVFAPGGLLSGPQGKSPDKDICADAVVAYLKDGTPIADTIRACTDIRKFIQVRHCKKGAVDLPAGVAIADGKYLGKAVRWYYNGRPGYIGAKDTGDKVAGSEGATPIMELPDYFPADVNHAHYIAVAMEMLKDIGV